MIDAEMAEHLEDICRRAEELKRQIDNLIVAARGLLFHSAATQEVSGTTGTQTRALHEPTRKSQSAPEAGVVSTTPDLRVLAAAGSLEGLGVTRISTFLLSALLGEVTPDSRALGLELQELQARGLLSLNDSGVSMTSAGRTLLPGALQLPAPGEIATKVLRLLRRLPATVFQRLLLRGPQGCTRDELATICKRKEDNPSFSSAIRQLETLKLIQWLGRERLACSDVFFSEP